MEDEYQRRKLSLASQRRELTRLQTDVDRRSLEASFGGAAGSRRNGGGGVEMMASNKENMDGGRGAGGGHHNHSPIEVKRASWSGSGHSDSTSLARHAASAQTDYYVEELEERQPQHDVGCGTMDEFADGSRTILGIDRLTWETEVASARRSMQTARGGITKASHARQRNDGIIRIENEFLSKIRRR